MPHPLANVRHTCTVCSVTMTRTFPSGTSECMVLRKLTLLGTRQNTNHSPIRADDKTKSSFCSDEREVILTKHFRKRHPWSSLRTRGSPSKATRSLRSAMSATWIYMCTWQKYVLFSLHCWKYDGTPKQYYATPRYLYVWYQPVGWKVITNTSPKNSIVGLEPPVSCIVCTVMDTSSRLIKCLTTLLHCVNLLRVFGSICICRQVTWSSRGASSVVSSDPADSFFFL